MEAARSTSTSDCNGRTVTAGTRVRVIAIAPSILERLDGPERERVQSMLGESFEVYEVDEWGGAWVQKWWHEAEDRAASHSIGLRSSEMEVVDDDV
jgi:hypothetical protein